MSLLLLALLATPDLTQQALDRYHTFASGGPAIEAAYTVESPGVPKAIATFVADRGKAFRIDGKWRGKDYSYVTVNGGTMRELERTERIYDEYPRAAPYGLIESKISAVQGFVFPFFLMSQDIRKTYKVAPTFVDQGQVLGRTVQTVRFKMTTQMGPLFHEYSIDTSGRIAQFAVYGGSVKNRPNAQKFTVTKLTVLQSVPASRWELPIPNGYVPYRLPSSDGPLAIGKPFPFAGWVGGNVKVGKQTLFALLGVDCAPSAASVAALADVRKAGVAVVELSDAATRGQANGRVYDPTGKSVAQLAAIGTPTFFLVGKDGKVAHLWMGYDPAQKRKFVSDIVAATKE